eukprot:6598855-Lingulodinium_polyedra.AAC.1
MQPCRRRSTRGGEVPSWPAVPLAEGWAVPLQPCRARGAGGRLCRRHQPLLRRYDGGDARGL